MRDVIEAWQPIGTAPKDGTDIVLCMERGLAPEAVVGFWDKYDGWCLRWDGYPLWSVTHWMPLQPLPRGGA